MLLASAILQQQPDKADSSGSSCQGALRENSAHKQHVAPGRQPDLHLFQDTFPPPPLMPAKTANGEQPSLIPTFWQTQAFLFLDREPVFLTCIMGWQPSLPHAAKRSASPPFCMGLWPFQQETVRGGGAVVAREKREGTNLMLRRCTPDPKASSLYEHMHERFQF